MKGIFDGTQTLFIHAQEEKQISPEEFLKDNDSYSFFSALGDTIRTEKHVTNLMDIQLILIEA